MLEEGGRERERALRPGARGRTVQISPQSGQPKERSVATSVRAPCAPDRTGSSEKAKGEDAYIQYRDVCTVVHSTSGDEMGGRKPPNCAADAEMVLSVSLVANPPDK